jgi:arylsulfatase A-like enzyme
MFFFPAAAQVDQPSFRTLQWLFQHHSRFRLMTLIVFVGFLHNRCTHTAAAESGTRPNIVVIMVDDMGYGDPGCYNRDSKIPMPHFNGLARDGMRFTDAHAPGPLCHLSRYGLLTGRYPFRAQPGKWRAQPTIADDRVTIASLLKPHGYQTAMVGKWHLGFQENGYDKPLPGGPVDRGFDSYFGIRASTDIPPYFYIRGNRAVAAPTNQIAARNSPGWTPIQGAFWRAGGIAPGLELKDVLPRFTDEAVKVIDQHAAADSEQPLMLYLAYPAPHTPWLPSREFDGSSKASMYGDFTVMVDAMIGRVLKALDKAKMTDNTLVIVTSDNGPVWYDTDVERFDHDSSGGLRGMKADAWEAGHRMPFVVRWPGVVKADSVSHQTICFTDLLATFAAIVGTELSADDGPDSFNLLPVLRGELSEDKPVRPSLAMASGNGTMTIRIGDWKLITGLGSGGFSTPRRVKPTPDGPNGQLYNLSADPSESRNLYARHPEVVKRLQAELKRVRESGRTR